MSAASCVQRFATDSAVAQRRWFGYCAAQRGRSYVVYGRCFLLSRQAVIADVLSGCILRGWTELDCGCVQWRCLC